MKARRPAVFVVPNSIVGHELVFKHYTNKVVVGNYAHPKATNIPTLSKNGQRRTMGHKN